MKKILLILVLLFGINYSYAADELSFIYINGSNNNDEKMQNWYENGVRKLHPVLRKKFIKNSAIKRYYKSFGSAISIKEEPVIFFWGDKSKNDLNFVKSQLDISKAISANATSIESAVAIKNTLNDVFIQKMNELFKCFKEVISKELPELELIESDSDYKKLTSAYYDKKSSTNPRISYKIKSFDDEVAFRIEIDYRMFWGIYSDKDTLSQNTISQLKKHFGITEKPRDEEWLYWEYMPENREDSCPNFKQENQALLDLFDDKLLDDFIKTSVNEIKNRLKGFI